MNNTIHLCVVAGLGLAAAGCGDNGELECAPGTFRDGKNCIAFDPDDTTAPVTTASPAGARARALPGFVVLSTDEPAKIFYTTNGADPDPRGIGEASPVVIPTITDGQVLKYFAVDAAGNTEAMHVDTYDVDVMAPAAVTNLVVTPSGQDATVTWTNPTDADFSGVLVARVYTIADAVPVPGTTYTVPASLTDSVQVIAVGNVATHTDVGLPTGPARYMVWAFDDLGNYSAPAISSAIEVGTLSTTATLTYDTAAQTLAVTAAPASLDLAGTTAELDAGTLTVHLSVKNLTAKHFQNPKILVTSVTNATFDSSDGTADGFPFASIGPGFFAPAAVKKDDLVFTAATGVVTIQLDLGHHASLITGWRKGCCSARPHRLIDAGSAIGSTGLVFSSPARSASRLGGTVRAGVLVWGRYYDVPTTEDTIERWDMVTQQKVGGVDLATDERGGIGGLFWRANQEYAVMKDNGYQNASAAKLVRLDENLVKTGELAIPGQHSRGHPLHALSPDGTTLAVVMDRSIVLVDLDAMAVKDMDTTTSAFDPIATGVGDLLRGVVWSTPTTLVALAKNGQVSVIKIGVTPYTTAVSSTTAKGWAIARMPDNRVWIGNQADLLVYDPADDSITASAYPYAVQALGVTDGELWVVRDNRVTVDQVDSTGAVVRTGTLPEASHGHFLMATQ